MGKLVEEADSVPKGSGDRNATLWCTSQLNSTGRAGGRDDQKLGPRIEYKSFNDDAFVDQVPQCKHLNKMKKK
jgi:hypothetical protein